MALCSAWCTTYLGSEVCFLLIVSSNLFDHYGKVINHKGHKEHEGFLFDHYGKVINHKGHKEHEEFGVLVPLGESVFRSTEGLEYDSLYAFFQAWDVEI